MNDTTQTNVSDTEIEKFNKLAQHWWDPDSEFKPLHDINPLRANWIAENCDIVDKTGLDIGCGGGLLCEALTHRGCKMTGLDMGEIAIRVAQDHAKQSKLDIHYAQTTVEHWTEKHTEQYDLITCLEMLEHVPDPSSTVQACAQSVKPGGHLFFSTINRNFKAFVFAIIGAEYILKLLPKGTHQYENLIRPCELGQWIRQAGCKVQTVKGLSYNPLSKRYKLTDDASVNYLLHAIKQ